MVRSRYAVEYEPAGPGKPGRIGVGGLGASEGCGYAVVALGKASASVEVRAEAAAADRLADGVSGLRLEDAAGACAAVAERLAAWLEGHGMSAEDAQREVTHAALAGRDGLRDALSRLYGVDRRAMDEAGVG